MKRLPSLNGLRAISITIVTIFHLILNNIVDFKPWLNIPLFNGQFGVSVFFVISGFLITSLLLEEQSRTGTISLKSFYLRRVLRIFPAYFFLLLVYFGLQLLGLIYIPRSIWLTSLTYTKYLNTQELYTNHLWSLSVEENFYLLWPMIFLARDKIRKNMVLAIILLVPMVRIWLDIYPVSWITDLSLFTRVDAIAIGCYFALSRAEILEYCADKWNKIFYVSLAVIFIIPWLTSLAGGTLLEPVLSGLGSLYGTIPDIAAAFIMLYSVFGPRGQSFRLLNTRLFNYVGVLSYSLYLWQELFIIKRTWWVTQFPQNILFVFAAAAFSYYVIERPFLRIKASFSRKKG